MSKPLPQNKLLEGIFEPWCAESTINDLIVIGEIPYELNGRFFRNGPNPQYVFSENYHFFEGDGMVHALHFKDSQVTYQNKWVRTNKFILERDARRSLFAGGEFYQWEPERGVYFGIMPRDGTSEDVIWIHLPNRKCLAIHTVAAYQENNMIILDTMLADNIPTKANGFKADADVFPAYLTRWAFDLNSKSLVSKTSLDNTAGEFPRIDDRFMGIKYNHIYTAATLHSDWYGFSFDSIIHYNLADNTKKVHDFGAGNMPLEPIFVPRNSNAPEGDGFLLTYVYRAKENRSDLIILDALHVDHDPLAIIQLPHRVPFGFHESWVPGQDLIFDR